MRGRRGWWPLGGVVLVLLVAVSWWAPDGKWVGLAQDLVSAAAAAALWVGVRRHRDASRRAWMLIAMGVTCWVIGDFVWDAYAFLGLELPDVSIADIFYLAAYPLLAAGIVTMAPREQAATCARDSSTAASSACRRRSSCGNSWSCRSWAPPPTGSTRRCGAPTRSPTRCSWARWSGSRSHRAGVPRRLCW